MLDQRITARDIAGMTVDVPGIDWKSDPALVMAGDTETNYQLFPGDRIYINADPLIKADNWLAKVFSPIERVLGITLLGGTTYQTFQSIGRGTGAGGVGFVPIVR